MSSRGATELPQWSFSTTTFLVSQGLQSLALLDLLTKFPLFGRRLKSTFTLFHCQSCKWEVFLPRSLTFHLQLSCIQHLGLLRNFQQYQLQGLTRGALALGSSREGEYNNIRMFTMHSGVYKRDITVLVDVTHELGEPRTSASPV